MVKAVIFDMDGVIIDSEIVYLQYMLEFARMKNPAVRIEQLYDMVGRTRGDSWKVMARAVDNGQSWEEIRAEFRTRDIYAEIDYRSIFRPDVKVVVEWLKEHGYQVGLASSTHLELILRVLTENGIKEYFDTVVSGAQFKESKPNPEIYHFTAGQLGVAEADCLVVEDSTVGITAASRAGMKVAALHDPRFGFDESLADYHISEIKEILDIVKES